MDNISYAELKPPYRILLGPGPSNISPRVQATMQMPLVSHLDPYFYSVMDDTVSLLRFVFQTKNELTLPISGSGTAGMEAGICNFLEPGDVAVIGVSGYFSERMVPSALKCGAEVVRVDTELGRPVEPSAIEDVLKAKKRVKIVGLAHAETSTGILQPLSEISQLAKKYGALFMVDAVASLGGQEVLIDDWGIDICFSGSQKCISSLPGLAPFTANQAAMSALEARTSPVPSLYLDLKLLSTYWLEAKKAYHHTAPIYLVYALHEALAQIADEGLEARFKRHIRHGLALQTGIEAMGLTLYAQAGYRMSTLTSVRVPNGIDDQRIRQRLLSEFGIEIGGGFGDLGGKIWRIGLMGHSSTEQNLLLVLFALEKLLAEEGYPVETGAGVTAAVNILREAGNEDPLVDEATTPSTHTR